MRKKNILFLVADDQRFNTIHALGNEEIQTPNLDALVKEGVAFENAYIPGGSSGAVCMPSRAMIHTSQTIFDLEECGAVVPDNHPVLGEELQKNGYHTVEVGKWHNGIKSFGRAFSDGEDIFFGGMWDHWNVPCNHFDPTKKYEEWKHFTQDPFSSNQTIQLPADHLELGKHSTDLFSDAVIDKIKAAAKLDQPFFINGNFLAPHDPRTMPKKYKNMYHPDKISLPVNFLPEHPFDFDVKAQRDESLEVYPRPEKAIRQHLADYYAMITHIDDRIGTIIDALKETGQYEDTLIVFTGDNGLALGQHGLMGKQNLYDHSIHVPLLVKGPGIPAGKRISQQVLLCDIFPSLLDYVGAKIPENIFGKSFLPLITENIGGRETIYLAFTDKIRGLLTKNYKLIEYATQYGNHTQLFDLKKDPLEMNNLAENPAYAELLTRLQGELFEEAEKLGDTTFSQGEIFWQTKAKNQGK